MIVKYLYPAVGGILLLALAISHTFMYQQGKNSVKLNVLAEKAKAEEKHENLQIEIYTLDDISLRRRFCHWVRDSKPKCLQTNIPIQ